MSNRDIVETIESQYSNLDHDKWYQVCLMLLARAQG